MIVLGVAGEPLGGGGVGVALRYEHAETDHTTLGAELGFGRGDEALLGAVYAHHFLIAVRTYGRFSPGDQTWTDLTYGAGLSVMRTGLVTASAHAGAGVSYPNGAVVPVAHAGLALAVPLRAGAPYGGIGGGRGALRPDPSELATPHADVFLYFDPGFVVHPHGTTFAVDAGIATPLVDPKDGQLFSLAVGTSVPL